MALTNARLKAMVDTEFSTLRSGGGGKENHAYIAFSTQGTAITASLAKILVPGGWSTPTAADPYIIANVNATETGTASSGITITHWATCSLGGTLGTAWITASGTDPQLVTGGKLSIAAGALKPCRITATP